MVGLCCCKSEDQKKKRRREASRQKETAFNRQEEEAEPEIFGPPKAGGVCVAVHRYDPGSEAEVHLEKGDRVEILSVEKDSLDFVFVRQLKKDGLRGYVQPDVLALEGSIEAEDYKRRDAGVVLLRQRFPPSAFLVRETKTPASRYERKTKMPGTATYYALSIKDANPDQRLCLHYYRIFQNADASGKHYYILATRRFPTIQGLIRYYQTHDVPENELHHRLTMPLRREPPVRKVLSVDMRDKWREIPRDQIELGERLGGGHFADVFKAIWKNPRGHPIEVAVKRLKDVTDKGKEDLFNEAFMMKDLCHRNIVRLYGVVSSGEPYFMVTELLRDGSLKQYLQQRRSIRLPPLPDIDLIDIATQVSMSRDVAHATRFFMEVMRDQVSVAGFVHRDLAARNILINVLSEKPVKIEAKVSDFGLAKILHNKDVYKMARDIPLPVRWLAPEALQNSFFSSRSDVWAFGATLCEVFGEGEDPFPNTEMGVVVKSIKHGQRPPPPKAMVRAGVDKTVYLKCTMLRREERPSFAELLKILESLLPSGEDP